MPLLQLGVPRSLVEAMDPFLRSVIEAGYNRPDPTVAGSYPSEPVPFQLAPPPTKWLSDIQSVGAGAAQTLQKIAGITQPNPIVNNQVSTLAIAQPNNGAPPVGTPAPNVNAVVADSPPPPDEEKKSDPAPPTPAAGTGPNKVEPPQQPKGGWKPGDLLRKLFGPKPATGGSSTTTTGTPDPQPAAPSAGTPAPADPHEVDSHESAEAGTGSAA